MGHRPRQTNPSYSEPADRLLIAEFVRTSTATQGFTEKVTDPQVLRDIAQKVTLAKSLQ